MLGYKIKELVGLKVEDTVAPEDQERVLANIHAERESSIQHEMVRKDGSRLSVEAHGRTVVHQGRHVRFTAIRDITEAKRSEAKLRQYAEALQALSRRLLDVQETERRALARELHDEVGQSLTLLRLALDQCLQGANPGAQEKLDAAKTILHDLVTRVRRMSLDLRPSMLDDLGLLPALLWQFDRFTSQTGIRVTFTQVGLEERRFGPHVETAAFRIVQEALTNAARHARVPKVAVHLGAQEGRLQVLVQDDGCGFDPAAALAGAKSSGLRGMHERARLLGGRLQVSSDPGAGTLVTAELPFDPANASPGDIPPAALGLAPEEPGH
jgi:signal transduction histidine kinase